MQLALVPSRRWRKGPDKVFANSSRFAARARFGAPCAAQQGRRATGRAGRGRATWGGVRQVPAGLIASETASASVPACKNIGNLCGSTFPVESSPPARPGPAKPAGGEIYYVSGQGGTGWGGSLQLQSEQGPCPPGPTAAARLTSPGLAQPGCDLRPTARKRRNWQRPSAA